LTTFPNLKHGDTIADSVSQPSPPLPLTKISPGTGFSLIDYIAEQWEWDAQGCLETNVHINPYYLCAMNDQYKNNHYGIKKKGVETHYDNVLKGENTAPRFENFNYGDGVQMLVGRRPGVKVLREWELHTLEDMRWTDNHQHQVNYWSRDSIKSMTWLMRQAAYAEHPIFAPQHCFNRYKLTKLRCTIMDTADQSGVTQLRKDT
jgi:hypothetical protein